MRHLHAGIAVVAASMHRILPGAAAFCSGVLLALLPASPAHAALPDGASVPGGVTLISLGPVSDKRTRPRAWLGEQPVLIAAEGSQWVAVIGLDLASTPGAQQLRVENTQGETSLVSFTVTPKYYPQQRITMKDSSKVQLSAGDLARVEDELATIQRLKRHWREAADTDLGFVLPAQGRRSGRFGVRRFFNGEPRSPHTGLDIAVPRGAAVNTSAGGRVLAVDDYFFNGKTVFIDHGNGLISMYCHLDSSAVDAGEAVVKGQRIGAAGMSGRATGPHLHWSVILNGAMVDPELFVAKAGTRR